MKILLVSWSTLPNKGGSSIIVESLANNFSASEMVVLGSREWRPVTNMNRPKGITKFKYFFSELYIFGRGYRYLVWFRKWRFRPLIRAIKNIIEEEKITHVIGVYPNPFYCHAACIAAKEMNVPFSSYFHNTYIENTAITDPKAPAIQQEIFDASDHIFVMSKGMQTFYEEKYQLKKFIPLVHTFNQFPETSQMTGLPPKNKSTYQLVAIGNFNESNLDATRRLVDTIKKNPKFELTEVVLSKVGDELYMYERKTLISLFLIFIFSCEHTLTKKSITSNKRIKAKQIIAKSSTKSEAFEFTNSSLLLIENTQVMIKNIIKQISWTTLLTILNFCSKIFNFQILTMKLIK